MTDILSATLEASPGTRGDKLPRIGSIWSNIDPIEKPEKKNSWKQENLIWIWFYFQKNTFIYKIIEKHFHYLTNIVFVACSVYLRFIFYIMTITKLLNEKYILLKRNYKTFYLQNLADFVSLIR